MIPRKIHRELKEIGWTKAADLAKVARRQGEQFDCATWLHKARETPKDKFHDEIEKLLTGESESSDLVYFKLYKSQIPVVEQALEIAGRMLGSDRSRGYCLELICADFLAGAGLHLENEQEGIYDISDDSDQRLPSASELRNRRHCKREQEPTSWRGRRNHCSGFPRKQD